MPDTWVIQKLMNQYNLNCRQAYRFYWYRQEGYDVERALKLVEPMKEKEQ